MAKTHKILNILYLRKSNKSKHHSFHSWTLQILIASSDCVMFIYNTSINSTKCVQTSLMEPILPSDGQYCYMSSIQVLYTLNASIARAITQTDNLVGVAPMVMDGFGVKLTTYFAPHRCT